MKCNDVNIVREHNVDVLIAGGRNMYTALKARIPFLDINQERDFGYEGYTGMIELARQLALTIENPVWEKVRRPSPWAKVVTALSKEESVKEPGSVASKDSDFTAEAEKGVA